MRGKGESHGKTKKNIEDAIDIATITADSLTEIALINAVAKEKNCIAKIGVRLNPDFSFDGKAGEPSKFGIDEEQFFAKIQSLLALENVEIVGLHVHIRSQALDDVKLGKYYANVLNFAQNVQRAVGKPLAFINMGSGIGIPYEITDREVNLQTLAEKTQTLIELFSQAFANTQIFIETGRYVVGKSGVYVTKVLDKKMSRGKTYVVLSNTLNGFIRPSIS